MLLYQRPACGSLFSTIPKFGQILPFLLLTYSVWTTDKKYLSLAPHLDEKYRPVDTKWRAGPCSAPQAPIPFVSTRELKESRRDKALGSLYVKKQRTRRTNTQNLQHFHVDVYGDRTSYTCVSCRSHSAWILAEVQTLRQFIDPDARHNFIT